MKKVCAKRKPWIVAHANKGLKRKAKLNRRRRHQGKRNAYIGHKSDINKWTIIAPEKVSLIGNRDETLEYFSDVFEKIQLCGKGDQIYFDFHNIKYISNDAIMYIIALITNAKKIRRFSVGVSGNLPSDPKVRDTLEKSGFYKYVQHGNFPVASSGNDRIQISSGKNINSPLVGTICEFVRSASETPCDTSGLYSIIIELMTNTNQHAYRDDDELMDNNWYIFAQNCSSCVKFVFLDTGVGIPKTIKKKVREYLKEFLEDFSIFNSDSAYIESALKGEERTETGESYRGQGLPEIYDVACSKNISDMMIMSGYGECRIKHDGSIAKYSLSKEFIGTLFTWKYVKRKE